MAQDIKSWAKEAKKVDQRLDRDPIDHEYFFRDPGRPMFVEDDLFFSPADGVLIYQTVVDDMKKPIDAKGAMVTLPQLMGDPDFNQPCLVLAVFMTAYDVHINRMPTAGIVRYRLLDPIGTRNFPMLETEKGLLSGVLDKSASDYTRQNERMINRIYAPFLDYTYYLVQLADEDVDIIQPFSVRQNKWYFQTERFSFIRWGSQVNVVLPLSHHMVFTTMQKTMTHVESGQDVLVKITDFERDT